MSISERLKKLRAEKGWSQKDLSFHSGVSTGMIGGIENNTREPSHRILVKLSKCLGVSVAYLSKGKEFNEDVLDNFIDELIENEIITDPNNIPLPIQETILKLVEAQILIKMNKPKKDN